VEVAPWESVERAVPSVAVGFVVDTHTFPPVLLIIQLERSTISRGDEIHSSIVWEATELAMRVLVKKGTSLYLN
jgi:hypothetical protein